MKTRLFLALSALGFCAGAAAEVEKPWEVAAELGVIATSGNTETTSIQAKLDAKQNLQRWHNHYILTALFKEDQITREDDTKVTEQTAEKYFGSVKSAYQLERENTNFFIFGSHTDDKFSSYSKYSTVAIGYGTRLYENDTMVLDAEIGPGYFRAKQVLADDTTQDESGVLLRGAASFKWQLSETAEFVQTLSVESAEDNTRTVAESSVTTRINGALQLKVGLNIANDSRVAPDKEKTDTTSYVNLVYNF
jgi:putative salt-induced outer membrane protein YdiY